MILAPSKRLRGVASETASAPCEKYISIRRRKGRDNKRIIPIAANTRSFLPVYSYSRGCSKSLNADGYDIRPSILGWKLFRAFIAADTSTSRTNNPRPPRGNGKKMMSNKRPTTTSTSFFFLFFIGRKYKAD